MKIQKNNVGIRISILKISCVPIFRQKNNFDFFDPNLPQNGFWDWNFKNLSADSRSAPPRDHVCKFLIKMDNFEFFRLNLDKLRNYVEYSASNNVEGVTES